MSTTLFKHNLCIKDKNLWEIHKIVQWEGKGSLRQHLRRPSSVCAPSGWPQKNMAGGEAPGETPATFLASVTLSGDDPLPAPTSTTRTADASVICWKHYLAKIFSFTELFMQIPDDDDDDPCLSWLGPILLVPMSEEADLGYKDIKQWQWKAI